MYMCIGMWLRKCVSQVSTQQVGENHAPSREQQNKVRIEKNNEKNVWL